MARGRVLDKFTFGGRVPGGVGLILAVTAACSLIVAFVGRHSSPLFDLAALVPSDVLRGQVWRLVTYAFIEPSPIGLIFQLLFLYWFGKDLADLWGSKRFLRVWLGLALLASVGTTVIAIADTSVREVPFLGGYALTAAFTVAWGLTFPDRRMLIYFFFPIRGVVIAWGTVAVTVILAIYMGWDHFLPELLAEGGMLALMFRSRIRRSVAGVQRAAKSAADARERAEKRKKAEAYLRVIEANDDVDDPKPRKDELN